MTTMYRITQGQLDALHRVERDLAASTPEQLARDRQIVHMILTCIEDAPRMNRADLLLAFEAGDLDNDTVILLFQEIISDGSVWKMTPCYRNLAHQLIAAGYCHHPRKATA